MDVMTDILHRHGSLVVFGVVLAEQLGLPLPALPLLVAAGVLIGTGHLGLFPAVGAAFVATLLADWLWYVAGQRRGRPILTLLCRIALEPDTCVRRTENVFRTHGPHALVLAKFVPGLSTIAPPLAGVVWAM
jgi:membrane protein DedA with SNARE-associated domain